MDFLVFLRQPDEEQRLTRHIEPFGLPAALTAQTSQSLCVVVHINSWRDIIVVRFRFLAAALVPALLAGCSGGDGSGLANQPPPPPFGASFSAIQANVFAPTCATTGCHQGAGAPQGLRLDALNSYGLLVDVASSEVNTLVRVAPNDPDNSYLIQKLEGTASVGAQMPLNSPALAQSTIDVIRQWISDGAIDDRTMSTEPVRVTSLSPVPGAGLATTPDDIIVMFDREVDASTVNANTFIVEGSGGDGAFDDGNEIQVAANTITTPSATPMSATFGLSGVVLADDTYRVILRGSGASVILDIDANALDGEYSGSFPSGNGTAGGDFVATFSVSTPAQMGSALNDMQASVFTPSCAFDDIRQWITDGAARQQGDC